MGEDKVRREFARLRVQKSGDDRWKAYGTVRDSWRIYGYLAVVKGPIVLLQLILFLPITVMKEEAFPSSTSSGDFPFIMNECLHICVAEALHSKR